MWEDTMNICEGCSHEIDQTDEAYCHYCYMEAISNNSCKRCENWEDEEIDEGTDMEFYATLGLASMLIGVFVLGFLLGAWMF